MKCHHPGCEATVGFGMYCDAHRPAGQGTLHYIRIDESINNDLTFSIDDAEIIPDSEPEKDA